MILTPDCSAASKDLGRRLLIPLMLLSLTLVVMAPAIADEATFLLENVTVLDRKRDEEDEVVNILVTNGILNLITKNDTTVEPGVPIFDANRGVALGSLEIGQSAAFLILDKSPREDVEVLLDTKTHAVFAIAGGQVRRNRLTLLFKQQPRIARGWFSYTPPPFALPVDIENSERWNHFGDANSRHVFSAAVVLDRVHWQQDAASEQQVGSLDDFEGGEIRGLRFGFLGAFNVRNRPWIYTFFAATNAFGKGFDVSDTDDFAVFDVRLDIPAPGNTTVSVGKQKEPINLERTTPLIFLPIQERSIAADALLPARNTGVVWSGMALGDRLSWAGGYFNDFIDSDTSFDDSANQLVGRFTGLPWVSTDESSLIHLGVGYRYSDNKEGFLVASEPR